VLLISEDKQFKPQIDIFDYGTGVSKENLSRIFEPFFTTSSQGSGLGLYLCRELCEANQATLSYMDINSRNEVSKQINDSALDEFSHCFRLQFSHPNREPFTF
jgi:two-component system sensor histidine kinase PilS (NtrC family)